MSNHEYAFPVHETPESTDSPGMTLRDYFAARAMQAALTSATLPGLIERKPETMAVIDKMAAAMYAIADAMVAARLESAGLQGPQSAVAAAFGGLVQKPQG